MKPKVLSYDRQMKSILYYSGILEKYQVDSFKVVYSFLCQNKGANKRRVIKMIDYYMTVLSAIKSNKDVARYFFRILKIRNVYIDFKNDVLLIHSLSTSCD